MSMIMIMIKVFLFLPLVLLPQVLLKMCTVHLAPECVDVAMRNAQVLQREQDEGPPSPLATGQETEQGESGDSPFSVGTALETGCKRGEGGRETQPPSSAILITRPR
ncbi:hypothetical protein AAFF_G00069430 [Aldrovandia affinis]|uniref:Secreted protein n=1 Tax=Aldrovandia affinis TaxID=143900 RepID=A0AAD7RZ68_9TELE|nr:hypothetical protein AAFF_G00069430 [Aldrovandia affinis]